MSHIIEIVNFSYCEQYFFSVLIRMYHSGFKTWGNDLQVYCLCSHSCFQNPESPSWQKTGRTVLLHNRKQTRAAHFGDHSFHRKKNFCVKCQSLFAKFIFFYFKPCLVNICIYVTTYIYKVRRFYIRDEDSERHQCVNRWFISIYILAAWIEEFIFLSTEMEMAKIMGLSREMQVIKPNFIKFKFCTAEK